MSDCPLLQVIAGLRGLTIDQARVMYLPDRDKCCESESENETDE